MMVSSGHYCLVRSHAQLVPHIIMRHDTCIVVVIGSSTQTRGVVHVVNTMEDIDWLLQHGDNGAYIVAMEDIMFNK